MPKKQVASRGVWDFGAPATEGVVLKFRVKEGWGGKLDLTFENPNGDANGEVTVQVSSDDSSYADTSAANNLAAVANATILQRARRDYTILLRRGIDKYVRVQAVGGCRLIMISYGDHILEPIQI